MTGGVLWCGYCYILANLWWRFSFYFVPPRFAADLTKFAEIIKYYDNFKLLGELQLELIFPQIILHYHKKSPTLFNQLKITSHHSYLPFSCSSLT